MVGLGRFARHLALVLLITFCISQISEAQSAAESEYELKAEVLYQFLSFVEWPSDVLAPFSLDSIVIGILGEDPFGDVLDRAVEGQTVGNRHLVLRRKREIQDLGFCHVVFISSSEASRLPEVLHALKNITALTVGDTDDFAYAGGMVGLTMEGNRVRFAVNIDAVEESELTLSSRILRLARIVRHAPDGEEP